MDVLHTFLITVAIVAGILSPFILIMLLDTIGKALLALLSAIEVKLEDVKKRPPFEEVEVNVNPGTHIMTARFIKHGNIVWQGSASQNRTDGSLEFKTDEKA